MPHSQLILTELFLNFCWTPASAANLGLQLTNTYRSIMNIG